MGGAYATFSRLSFINEHRLDREAELAGTVFQAPIQITLSTEIRSSFYRSPHTRAQAGLPATREVLGEGSPARSGSFTWLGEWDFLHTSTNICG